MNYFSGYIKDMKFKNLATFQKKIAERLGDDLVYSLAFDDGKFFFLISTHKSKTKRYKDKKYKTMQSCIINPSDFGKQTDEIVEEIVKMYSPILETYEPDRSNDVGNIKA